MTKVIFYDSLGCIGGNKIVVESEKGSGLLLDFGYNFKLGSRFLESPFLTLREYRILFDGFKTGFLPIPKGILQGLYREDLYKLYKDEIEKLYNIDLSKKPKITHVLISHGHSDHIGHIKYLNQQIQPVCGKVTKCVLENYEELYSEKSNFTGVLHYFEKYNYKENGFRDYKGPVRDRNLKILDDYQFTYLPGNDDFLVAFYPTDHSLVGAGAYLILDKNSKKKIIYSGDLRLHGPNSDRVRYFIKKAQEFEPDVLIVEGTRIDAVVEEELKSEKVVEQEITDFLINLKEKNPESMVFFECSRTDLFRIQSFYQAATKANRKLVIKPKTYYLLQKCLSTGVKGLDRINLEKIKVYLPRKNWGVYDSQDYKYNAAVNTLFKIDAVQNDPNQQIKLDLESRKIVKAQDLAKNPGDYLTYLDLYSVNELCDINPSENMYFILSKSEWDDPESQINEEKKLNWLKLFHFKEDNIFKAHCSGHITPNHLKNMINTIKPKKVFPIHTLYPEKFKELGLLPEIEILIPKKEKDYLV